MAAVLAHATAPLPCVKGGAAGPEWTSTDPRPATPLDSGAQPLSPASQPSKHKVRRRRAARALGDRVARVWSACPFIPSLTSRREQRAHSEHTVYAALPGRLLILGFGSIGAGVLPLLLRHVAMQPSDVTLLTAPDRGAEARAAAARYGTQAVVVALTPENYEEARLCCECAQSPTHASRQVLTPLLSAGDFLLNVSVDVSSVALLAFAAARGVLYLDTVVEPWPGGYNDPKLPVAARSNYAQREEMLALRASLPGPGPTALVTHGANPGLVSHLVKQALLDVAAAAGMTVAEPTSRAGWAALAAALGVKAIHISERDSQASAQPKRPGEFVNTWSVDGFISEGCQPAELGWGSHERALPPDAGVHAAGSGAAIYLNRPGCATKVRSWSPGEGPFHGFLITHNEAVSIADFLTLREGEGGRVAYRPTVHYSYHPCDAAIASLHELAGKNFAAQPFKRLLARRMW